MNGVSYMRKLFALILIVFMVLGVCPALNVSAAKTPADAQIKQTATSWGMEMGLVRSGAFDHHPETGTYDDWLYTACAVYSLFAYDDITFDFGWCPIKKEKRDKKPTILNYALQANGFLSNNIENYNYDIDDDPNKVAFTIANRAVTHFGEANRPLVVVIIRGTPRTVEWQGNMDITGDYYYDPYDAHYNFENHESFIKAKDDVADKLTSYLYARSIRNALVVVTGHSRGAAVANLLANDLTSHSGPGQRVEKVYAYTYATPNCTVYPNTNRRNIYNFCFSDDFVPQIILSKWGYGKHGRNFRATAQNLKYTDTLSWYTDRSYKSHKLSLTAQKPTSSLLNYVSNKWPTLKSYYSTTVTTNNANKTLYKFMRNVVAKAAMDDTGAGWALTNANGAYAPINDFFTKGLSAQNYVNDTHDMFTYYTAREEDKFFKEIHMGSGGGSRNVMSMQLFSVDTVDNPNLMEVTALKIFAQQGNNAENLGWDLNDVNTWDGVEWSDDTENHVTDIDISFQNLTGALDVSGFSQLRYLDCSGNDLDNIIVGNCTSLKTFVCAYNFATTLSLVNCPAIVNLDCSWNQISALDVSEFSALAILDCNNNLLTALDINNNLELQELYCSGNELTYLDVSANENLTQLRCDYNYFDINNNPVFAISFDEVAQRENGFAVYEPQKILPNITFNQDDIAKLSTFAAQNDNLSALYWELSNPQDLLGVEWIKIGNEYRLCGLSVEGLGLSGDLDLSGMPYLEYVLCSGNHFSSIDVSNCPMLTKLFCSGSDTVDLNVEGCVSLSKLNCSDNYLNIQSNPSLQSVIDTIEENYGYVVCEPQKILADVEDFNQYEYNTLLAFAEFENNLLELDWDIDKPGEWSGISWELIDEKYRVTAISMDFLSVTGKLDLSGFGELTYVSFTATGIEQIFIPNSVLGLAAYTFAGCSNLTKIIMPDTLTALENGTFAGCKKLAGIIIPQGLEVIGNSVFSGCEALSDIAIPQSVVVVGEQAFSDCSNLKSVTFGGDAPWYFGEGVFDNAADGFTIYCYRGTDGWTTPEWNGWACQSISSYLVKAVKDGSTIKVSVINIFDDYSNTPSLAIALYGKQNKLIALKVEKVTEELIEKPYNISGVNSAETIKVFLWDSLNTLMPLSDVKYVFPQTSGGGGGGS